MTRTQSTANLNAVTRTVEQSRFLLERVGMGKIIRLISRIIWPEPWANGRYRTSFALLCICTGLAAGAISYVSLKDKVRRTVETSITLDSSHRDGKAFFIYAREAGIRQVMDSLGENWVLGPFDSNEQPRVSRHRVQINGVGLNAAHAAHGAIVREGGGLYSFWGGETPEKGGIYFSLPPQIASIEDVVSVKIEWHVIQVPRAATQFLFAMFAGWGVCVLVAAWGFGGSLLAASCWVALGLMWGGVAGVYLPEISGADGHMVQQMAGEILAIGFGLALGLAAVVWLFALLFRYFQVEPPERGDARVGQIALGMVAPAFLLLWLGATWVGPAPFRDWTGDGPSSAVLGGRLPFSDAAGWYVGSGAVKDGVEVEWVARRPMHALLRAGEQFVAGGNYQLGLIVQTLLVGGAIGGLLVALSRVASGAAALVVLVGLVKYGGGFVGSYLSEASGLAAACLGLALALLGWKDRRISWRIWGYCLLALAATLRPGPMFVLLALPAAEFLLEAGRRWYRALVASAAVGAVLILASLAFRLIATDDAAPNANSANTILGIAMGTDWATATDRFFREDPNRTKLSTKEMTRQMYLAAWLEFKRDPSAAFRFMKHNFQEGVHALTVELVNRLLGSPRWAMLLWLLAVAVAVRTVLCGERWPVFLGLLAAGLGVSLPLIWRDGGWRGVTIGLPVCFVFLALIVSRPVSRATGGAMKILPRYLQGVGIMMGALIAIGSISHLFSVAPQLESPIVVSGSRDAVANIVSSRVIPSSFGPLSARAEEFGSALHQTGLSIYQLDESLSQIASPYAIAVVTPNRAKPERSLWMVFPGLTIDSGTRVRVDQYKELPDGYVALAEKWTILR